MEQNKSLYVMRHGAAQGRVTSDQARTLSPDGHAEVGIAAAKLPGQIDQLFVSPYVRAQQTAQIVRRIKGFSSDFVTSELITPNGKPALIDQWLSALNQPQGWRSALLVCHQPLVGLLVEYFSGQPCPQVPTASIVCLTGEVLGLKTCQVSWVHQ